MRMAKMNNRKHLYDRIFKWCADVGHCPLESDMNELIYFIMDDDPKSEGGSPFATRETDIPEFGGKSPQPETGADIMNALEEFRDEVNRHSRNSSELFSDETTETIIQALTAQLTARKVDAQPWFDKLREHKAKMPTHDFTPDEFRAWNNERNILMHDLWRAAVKPAPASDDGVK